MYVEYRSNNSGGGWWLKDEDWYNLEKAGWIINWYKLYNTYTPDGAYVRDQNGVPVLTNVKTENGKGSINEGKERFLGALASYAYFVCNSMEEAVKSWEKITGQSSREAGCPCCGQPHTFTLYTDTGKYVCSGPNTEYTASW